MDLDLRGRKVLVTGASKLLEQPSRAFAAEGCDLVLVARSADASGDLSFVIERDLGTAGATIVLDLTARDAIARRRRWRRRHAGQRGRHPRGDLRTVGAAEWRAAWQLE